jgi:uncharacterized membrane protein YqgA involved in biofilm formation
MPTRLPIATFVNMATVTVGSLIGMSLQQVFPENIQAIIFQAIGLGTLLIGILMSLKLPDGYLLVLIFSLILGGVTGELIGLDAVLAQMGESIKSSLNLGDPLFTEGLVTAFLLFCVGSMTIVGAIEEGLQGKRELLYVKSMLDGVASIAFASTYGIGVLFSIFPMLLFQGGMTVLAVWIKPIFTDLMLNMLNAVGGILILGIGINLLKMADINLENLLPSLVFVLLLTPLYKRVRARS